MITIQNNGIVITIAMMKHLGINVKIPKILLCFDYQNGVTNKEENIMFQCELELFLLLTSIYPSK